VDANAAVAIPIHDASGAIRGVVGIAYMGERDITEAELAALREQAERIPG
jgi:DNA-binding IclR family transcriptional regulator